MKHGSGWGVSGTFCFADVVKTRTFKAVLSRTRIARKMAR
jgi:hypothetical protein